MGKGMGRRIALPEKKPSACSDPESASRIEEQGVDPIPRREGKGLLGNDLLLSLGPPAETAPLQGHPEHSLRIFNQREHLDAGPFEEPSLPEEPLPSVGEESPLRSDPEGLLPVRVEEVDVLPFRSQGNLGGDPLDGSLVGVVDVQATPLRPDPEAILPVFLKGLNIAVFKGNRGKALTEDLEGASIEPVEPLLGPDPEKALPVLEQGLDRVLGETVPVGDHPEEAMNLLSRKGEQEKKEKAGKGLSRYPFKETPPPALTVYPHFLHLAALPLSSKESGYGKPFPSPLPSRWSRRSALQG